MDLKADPNCSARKQGFPIEPLVHDRACGADSLDLTEAQTLSVPSCLEGTIHAHLTHMAL